MRATKPPAKGGGSEAWLHAAMVDSAVGLHQTFAAGDVTAIIAANDQAARSHHLKWCQCPGLRVPQDLSILAFDNSRYYAYDPLNSVGWASALSAIRRFTRSWEIFPW